MSLQTHLQSGQTTLCQCWGVIRKDGTRYGFTDHDVPLSFEGFTFKADTGLSAHMLSQGTGLSVDNTEALGALTDVSLTETDIAAGRFDGAEIYNWLVNWANTEERALQFRGHFGEISRTDGAFRVELRGLSEPLNQVQGRHYHSGCAGGKDCCRTTTREGYYVDVQAEAVTDQKVFTFASLEGFEDGWFEHGRMEIGGEIALFGHIKRDRIEGGLRRVELWEALRVDVPEGTPLRLHAGCDGRPETCHLKFNNFLNYRGFPHIPGEDWLARVPRKGGS